MAADYITTQPPAMLLLDAAAGVLALGRKRARWMHEHYEVFQPHPQDAPYVWTEASGLSVEGIQVALDSEPTLRECDFCHGEDVAWLVNHRHIVRAQGDLKHMERPFWACTACAKLIRANNKRGLLVRCTEALLEEKMPEEALADPKTRKWAWGGYKRQARERISVMFAFREGFPVSLSRKIKKRRRSRTPSGVLTA